MYTVQHTEKSANFTCVWTALVFGHKQGVLAEIKDNFICSFYFSSQFGGWITETWAYNGISYFGLVMVSFIALQQMKWLAQAADWWWGVLISHILSPLLQLPLPGLERKEEKKKKQKYGVEKNMEHRRGHRNLGVRYGGTSSGMGGTAYGGMLQEILDWPWSFTFPVIFLFHFSPCNSY